ncbi:hypothetical protein B0H11DRAFT_1904515 [Mycena galericulata]|nr:hypothetical protein B0H11DRAFT_1904515 [Mycena galericulata]
MTDTAPTTRDSGTTEEIKHVSVNSLYCRGNRVGLRDAIARIMKESRGMANDVRIAPIYMNSTAGRFRNPRRAPIQTALAQRSFPTLKIPKNVPDVAMEWNGTADTAGRIRRPRRAPIQTALAQRSCPTLKTPRNAPDVAMELNGTTDATGRSRRPRHAPIQTALAQRSCPTLKTPRHAPDVAMELNGTTAFVPNPKDPKNCERCGHGVEWHHG